ncbi:MAG: Rieske (2Fe-2S) protein [Cellvibrionaceae bacterium]
MTPDHHPLCHLDDIPNNGSKGFSYQGQAIFAVRKNDNVFVYSNQCPHLGLPLEWQADKFLTNDDSLIQCATHGALFEIDSGQCIVGPCQGQKLIRIETSIHDQFVYCNL